MQAPLTAEKHALIEAATIFEDAGIDIGMPWEGDLSDRDRKLYETLVAACRVYHLKMLHPNG